MKETSPDEIQLVKDAQAGDEKAFSLLHKKLYPLTYSVIKKKLLEKRENRVEVCKDICQDTWLDIHKDLGSFQHRSTDSPFTNWICKIARNRFSDWLRKRNTVKSGRDYEIGSVNNSNVLNMPASDDTTKLALDNEQRKVIREKIDSLPEMERRVCDLRYNQELKITEIASCIGKSEKTVRSWIAKARIQLRPLLSKEDIQP